MRDQDGQPVNEDALEVEPSAEFNTGEVSPAEFVLPLAQQEQWIQDATREIFGDRADLAERFVQHLVTTGIEWGLLGPHEIDIMWERHLLNCAVVYTEIPDGSLVADVGSGAGLPGIALALAKPEAQFILIEPLERRVNWLDRVVDDLGLDNVDVIRARAEQVVDTVDVDIVTARAVSALRTLLPLTVPLLHGEGRVLAIKGKSAPAEVEKASKVLKKLKAGPVGVFTVGDDLLPTPTTLVSVDFGLD